jgi:hypothetical protein
MMHRIPFIILLVVSGVHIRGCAVLGRENLPPKCDPQLQALLLTTDDLPPSWTSGPPVQDDEFREGAIDSCLASFYVIDGVAGQIVNEYSDEAQAIRGYTNLISYFAWKKRAGPSDGITYVSGAADEYFLECAIPVDRPMCQFIGRYGRLVTRFNTHFRPEFMTEDELVMILQVIDDRMNSSLSNTPVAPMR